MNIRIKKRIFDKLYEDLKHAEIIDCKGSIWVVDREKKYWYLEYKKSGVLYLRDKFFTNFFLLFSMALYEYKLVIADWVEEVLNCKVDATDGYSYDRIYAVEDVLNCNK